MIKEEKFKCSVLFSVIFFLGINNKETPFSTRRMKIVPFKHS